MQVDANVLSLHAKSSFASGSWIRTPEWCSARSPSEEDFCVFAACALALAESG